MIKLNISAKRAWCIYNSVTSFMLFVGTLITVALPFWWWVPSDPHTSATIWFGDEAVQEAVKAARGMQMMALIFFLAAFIITFFNKGLAAFLICLGGICAGIGPTVFLVVTKTPFGPLHGVSYVVCLAGIIYPIVYTVKFCQRQFFEEK